jgi:hypothetical protein
MMEKYTVYTDYAHHMAFLRASFNRVHNFANTAPRHKFSAETCESVRQEVMRCYRAQVKNVMARVRSFERCVNMGDGSKIQKAARLLHLENRNVQRLSQLFETTIVSGRRGPQDFDEPLRDKDGNILYKTDGAGKYIGEVDTETGEFVKIERFSGDVNPDSLSADVSEFIETLKGYADLLETQSG